MLRKTRILLAAVAGALLLASSVQAAALTDSLKEGTPDLKSAGPLAFAPEGILLVGDSMGASIFAIDTNDRSGPATGKLTLAKVDEKIASLLGADPKEIAINDMAVNPASGKVYLSVARGKGPTAAPALIRVARDGKLEMLALKNVKFAKATIPNPPNLPSADAKPSKRTPSRTEAITNIAFVDGKVIVAGMSNEEFASNLRVIPFPFGDVDKGTSIEIYHGNHGALETHSPVRTFVPFTIGGQPNLLAAYTCTPLVKFPISDLKPGQKVKGVTIAELGQGNRPLDMIVYKKDGKDFLLLSNSARGVMKIPTQDIEKQGPITERVGGTAGLKYETIKELKGVEQLAQLDKDQAVLLVRVDGALNLESILLP